MRMINYKKMKLQYIKTINMNIKKSFSAIIAESQILYYKMIVCSMYVHILTVKHYKETAKCFSK